jgi:hypothetical protein
MSETSCERVQLLFFMSEPIIFSLRGKIVSTRQPMHFRFTNGGGMNHCQDATENRAITTVLIALVYSVATI